MKIIDRSKKKFVKILIGTCETGDTNISKPIMSISVDDISVPQVYEKIFEMITKEQEDEEKSVKRKK